MNPEYLALLADLEKQHGLPGGLLPAVMQAESGGNPKAVSPAGAQGIFQFMPKTAQAYGIDPLDPHQAATGAARMYADLGKQFKGDIPSMLAAYNWGSGNLTKQGMQNAPQETRDYIQRVQGFMGQDTLVGASGADGLTPEEEAELAELEELARLEAEAVQGLTPEEEAELAELEAMEAGAPAVPAVAPEPGFLGEVKESLTTRGNELRNIGRNAGNQSLAETGFQGLGTAIGAGWDIAGNALGRMASAVTPDAIETPIREGASSAMQSFSESPLGAMAAQGMQKYNEWAKANPRAARNVSAFGNIASVVPGSKAVQGTANVAAKGLSRANELLGKNIYANADEIRSVASQSYKRAAETGGVLKPELTNEFVDVIEKLKPQTEIGRIVGGDSDFTKVVDRVSKIRDKPMSLEAAQELDELLGDAIDNFSENGKLKKEGKKLLDVQSKLRNMIDNADEGMIEGGKEGFEALKEGRKLWAASNKLADIERIITRAEMMDNPAAGIKSGFRTLYNNPSRMKGFNKEEKAAIKKAAESGAIPDMLRMVAGSRLIPIITAGSSGGLGATAAAAAGSMAARGAANRVQLRKANNLSEIVSQGSGIEPKRVPLIRRRSALEQLAPE